MVRTSHDRFDTVQSVKRGQMKVLQSYFMDLWELTVGTEWQKISDDHPEEAREKIEENEQWEKEIEWVHLKIQECLRNLRSNQFITKEYEELMRVLSQFLFLTIGLKKTERYYKNRDDDDSYTIANDRYNFKKIVQHLCTDFE